MIDNICLTCSKYNTKCPYGKNQEAISCDQFYGIKIVEVPTTQAHIANLTYLPTPYYQDDIITIYCADCRDILPLIPDKSIDLILTDPPYGISFMGKSWDKALPDKKVWAECLRVLKPGAFAFVMSIPRADCLSRMIINLEDAGFKVNFTPIFWAYASGFPKAQNIGKAVDKRLEAEREIVGKKIDISSGKPMSFKQAKAGSGKNINEGWDRPWRQDDEHCEEMTNLTAPATPQAKALDGSYGGFQPKPAVEVIIVAMKPLSEKTYVDQALKNKKGITWLDEGRIPYENEGDKQVVKDKFRKSNADDGLNATIGISNKNQLDRQDRLDFNRGRFPTNLLVSDDVLNDGRNSLGSHSQKFEGNAESIFGVSGNQVGDTVGYGDSGSFSRYFDLDKWFEEKIKLLPASVQKTFPFLIVPKASKSEKNKGCEELPMGEPPASARSKPAEGRQSPLGKTRQNFHPTVKPLKLMSYLITLGSREGDVVLDPFMGSGSTLVAAISLGFKAIGIETSEEYCEIAVRRCLNQDLPK